MTTQVICIPNSDGTFNSQLHCENDINDASVLPPPPVEQDGDIANYAYIWFNKSKPLETIIQAEKNFIHETITKGTFPTYLNLKAYTYAEKMELFANEITFVKKQFSKKGFSHITILQIPRILYDLFNLLFYYYKYPNGYKFTGILIPYSCRSINDKIDKIEDYIYYTNKIIEKCKDNIFELNNRIITFLNAYKFLDPINIVKNYDKILNLIISKINVIPVTSRKHESPRIDTDVRIKIFHEILDFEKKSASESILLYRGADFTKDSTIENKDGKQYPCSLSINLSILSGFIGDVEACTMHYMTDPSVEKKYGKNDKIKYTIKKFMFGDGSKEDSLFFIPPIPPYLQLYCEGELWHPRTKIGNNSPVMTEGIHPKGLYCSGYDFSKKFTYLQSNKTMAELETMYQSYKEGNIATWRKYIKYKTKYLELKNQLGK